MGDNLPTITDDLARVVIHYGEAASKTVEYGRAQPPIPAAHVGGFWRRFHPCGEAL